MKILNVFNHYLESGGEAGAIEKIVQSLSEILEIERCDFFSSDWIGPNAPGKLLQAAFTFRNPQSLRKIRQHQVRFKANAWLVHNVFPVGSAAIYREAERLKVPIIQYLHNFRPFSLSGSFWADHSIIQERLTTRLWYEIERGVWQGSRAKTAWLAIVLLLMQRFKYWRSVKAWIAVSEFVRGKFIEAGIPADQVFVLRHFWKPQNSFVTTSIGDYYLFLGRLLEAKGILVLLDCWKMLERELGDRAPRLLIAGDGPLREVVSQRCAQLRRASYAGTLDEPAKIDAIRSAKAMVVPSLWWEPLGLVVYEAYDFSRPVLAAASGGLPEIVVDGETGLLHQPGNAEQLAQQVMQLEREPETRRTMGRHGRAWLKQNADEAKWREEFLRIARHAQTARNN